MHEQLRGLLARMRAKGPPAPQQRRALAEGCERIERAGLLVVNARTAHERQRGEAMLAQLEALRKDQVSFREVVGPLAKRHPITARVADLSSAEDPGVRQVLARVRRTVRRCLETP